MNVVPVLLIAAAKPEGVSPVLLGAGMFAGALLIGLAVALFIWGGRERLRRHFEAEERWISQTALRFSPKPIDARARTIRWYVFFGVLLILLCAFGSYMGPGIWVGIALWVLIYALRRIPAEMAWNRRRRQIDGQIAATIATMCNSIRAGLTLVQSIQRLAEQADEPIRTEFQIMANRYAFGADLESTIQEAKSRLNLQNFNLFASAILLNREMGGDVAQTLSRISQSLDRLRQMKKTVEAHTAEGRTNIKILLCAPLVFLIMLAFVAPEGVKLLFTSSQGWGLLVIAGLLTGTGIYFAARITRSEV